MIIELLQRLIASLQHDINQPFIMIALQRNSSIANQANNPLDYLLALRPFVHIVTKQNKLILAWSIVHEFK
ncbi:hypothetical protein D3C77_789800 [compost metagenome]